MTHFPPRIPQPIAAVGRSVRLLVFLSTALLFSGITHPSLAQDPEAEFQKGVTLFEDMEYEEAEKAFTACITAKPDHAEAWHYRGKVRHELGTYNGPDGALADYTQALKLDPDNPIILGDRGMANFEIDDRTGAERDFSKVIDLDPNNAVAYYVRGLIRLDNNNRAEACPDLRKAVSLKFDYTRFRGFPDPQQLISQNCR